MNSFESHELIFSHWLFLIFILWPHIRFLLQSTCTHLWKLITSKNNNGFSEFDHRNCFWRFSWTVHQWNHQLPLQQLFSHSTRNSAVRVRSSFHLRHLRSLGTEHRSGAGTTHSRTPAQHRRSVNKKDFFAFAYNITRSFHFYHCLHDFHCFLFRMPLA